MREKERQGERIQVRCLGKDLCLVRLYIKNYIIKQEDTSSSTAICWAGPFALLAGLNGVFFLPLYALKRSLRSEGPRCLLENCLLKAWPPVRSNRHVCGDLSEPDMLFSAQCHSFIRHEARNCYVPLLVLPTSGWVWSWRACYFLPAGHSQRSFREDQRDTYRQNPILPQLAEEPDFDSPFTQHKRSSGNALAGGFLWSSRWEVQECVRMLGSALLAAMLLL